MNAIQKAIALLRNPVGHSQYECAESADELEALLKQEPVALLLRKHSWAENQYDAYPPDADLGREWADERFHVYRYPRPPCDLKALAVDVMDATVSAMDTPIEVLTHYERKRMRSIDLDAILAKHTGGVNDGANTNTVETINMMSE